MQLLERAAAVRRAFVHDSREGMLRENIDAAPPNGTADGGNSVNGSAAPSAGATAARFVIRKADVEIRSLVEWRLYASPRGGDAQWKDYRPAKELARAWCPDGVGPYVPAEARALLESRSEFAGFVMTEAIPDHRVRFDDLPGEPANADLIAIGNANGEEFVLGVQGKGDEPFGAYMGDELLAAARRMAHETPAPSHDRIAGLAKTMLPPRLGGEPQLGELRYQLFTAIAGTLAMATERQAPRAVFMIHEFRNHLSNDASLADNHRDLERFVERMTNSRIVSMPMNHLAGPFRMPGNSHISPEVELYIGKARRELLAFDF